MEEVKIAIENNEALIDILSNRLKCFETISDSLYSYFEYCDVAREEQIRKLKNRLIKQPKGDKFIAILLEKVTDVLSIPPIIDMVAIIVGETHVKSGMLNNDQFRGELKDMKRYLSLLPLQFNVETIL